MQRATRTLAVTAGLLLILVACEAELTLEPAPEAISQASNPRDECEGNPYWKADNFRPDGSYTPEASDPPGTNAVSIDASDFPTISYTINAGSLTAIYVKAGPTAYPVSTSGSFDWPDDLPDISHITFCFAAAAETTTTQADPEPTTTVGGETTTTGGGDTTTTQADPVPTTTTTIAEQTTTTQAGATTVTQAGDTTTTIEGQTTTTAADGTTTITEAGDTTTTADGGATTVTQAQGETTTTAAGDATTTSSGETDSTLAFTGPSGPIGPGYLAVIAAALMLLGWGLLRRRTD